jgi:ubiquinol-cytochrome c reductase cytochrome b subunit
MTAEPQSLPRSVDGTLTFTDDRLGVYGFLNRNIKKVFPDHWSFMLGEIALYSFVVLLLTGTFLTLWFKPDMTEVIYHGSYQKLDGVQMSQAYESALHISFDVRGGLLIRQIHHWAAVTFVAAIMLHMLRVFFTGAYRKPRDLNWLIGLTMFTLALIEGLFGYSLPDDALSGAGLRITAGVTESIPLVGTYASFFLFGGEYPGQDVIPRLFTLHVLLIPGLILTLVTAHLMVMWWLKHTAMPVKGQTDEQVVGYPFYPVFMAKTGAFFLFTFGVIALLGTLAQINPIWLYGPYDPAAVSAGSQPDFYLGFLEGALRIMPNWETNIWGHTIPWNVLIPALVPLGIVMTGAGLWPWIERWVTGDQRQHHVNDRPRNAPVRTASGLSIVVFYGTLWLAGGNDIIADKFDVSLYATTWFFRFAIFLGPIATFMIAKRVCLGLQRKDAESMAHGYESGIIQQLPSGAYIEVHKEVPEEPAIVLLSKEEGKPALPPTDESGIPANKGPLEHLRARLMRYWYFDSVPVEEGHGDDHAEVESRQEHKELTKG